MTLSRRRFLVSSLSGPGLIAAPGRVRAGAEPHARLGILLDTSAEMGFLVPQVRKERRILDGQRAEAGLPPLALREIEGAALDREASTSVGARRNVLYALKSLFEEADTVLWITSLKGDQSSQGIFAVEGLLKETVAGRASRRLVIRNVWQEQLLAGDQWVLRPPAPESDPLDPRNRPGEWYRLVGEGRGLIQRSWQVPPSDLRGSFAFPARITSAAYLGKLGFEGGTAEFDQNWARELGSRHGLHFCRTGEEWPPRITGRRWVTESTLLPFPDETLLAERSEKVLEELCARETVEEDLVRIGAEKLGVVFGFGYVSQELKRHLANRDRPPRNWRDHYLADLVRIGGECARNAQENESRPDRIYATERIELAARGSTVESPDPLARRIARMSREENCDAVYLFTNGYLGGGDYGTWSLELPLLALAIRETGTRLFVRVPFEFGPVPLDLSRLAMASGGGVFRGRADDPDWIMGLPDPAWPELSPDF